MTKQPEDAMQAFKDAFEDIWEAITDNVLRFLEWLKKD